MIFKIEPNYPKMKTRTLKKLKLNLKNGDVLLNVTGMEKITGKEKEELLQLIEQLNKERKVPISLDRDKEILLCN